MRIPFAKFQRSGFKTEGRDRGGRRRDGEMEAQVCNTAAALDMIVASYLKTSKTSP